MTNKHFGFGTLVAEAFAAAVTSPFDRRRVVTNVATGSSIADNALPPRG
ncbi:hypothetical protein [Bradyrhizobium sp. ORS 111]